MNTKFILDATAGFRMMWIEKQHPNAIYLDQREKCKPDVVGDFRDLRQFSDESFRLVVFDPPHILRREKWDNTANLERDFGWLNAETYPRDLTLGFRECWRVLQPWGILIFKWSDYSASLSKVLQYAPTKPLFCQQTYAKPNSKGKTTKTVWCCFMKIPNVA